MKAASVLAEAATVCVNCNRGELPVRLCAHGKPCALINHFPRYEHLMNWPVVLNWPWLEAVSWTVAFLFTVSDQFAQNDLWSLICTKRFPSQKLLCFLPLLLIFFKLVGCHVKKLKPASSTSTQPLDMQWVGRSSCDLWLFRWLESHQVSVWMG